MAKYGTSQSLQPAQRAHGLAQAGSVQGGPKGKGTESRGKECLGEMGRPLQEGWQAKLEVQVVLPPPRGFGLGKFHRMLGTTAGRTDSGVGGSREGNNLEAAAQAQVSDQAA